MGSSQALSNGHEAQELAEMIGAFERGNQVGIVITLGLEDTPKGRALRVVGAATNLHADAAVRARWASAHTVLPGKEYKSLMGLVTTLLYRLDFEIGVKEMEAIGIKSAQHPAH